MCGPVLGECINMSKGFASCSEYCQGKGEQCVENGCEGSTYKGYNDTNFCMNDVAATSHSNPCDHINTWGPTQLVIRCCCTDST